MLRFETGEEDQHCNFSVCQEVKKYRDEHKAELPVSCKSSGTSPRFLLLWSVAECSTEVTLNLECLSGLSFNPGPVFLLPTGLPTRGLPDFFNGTGDWPTSDLLFVGVFAVLRLSGVCPTAISNHDFCQHTLMWEHSNQIEVFSSVHISLSRDTSFSAVLCTHLNELQMLERRHRWPWP